jgi:MULE transposase domain
MHINQQNNCLRFRMCRAPVLWMDGTFKSCPSIFQQIYTIHVKIQDQFIPVAMALLPDKAEATYRRLFHELIATATGFQLILAPATIHTDFERAAMNAIQAEFGIYATGCVFHYTQNIYRKVQALGLSVAYNTDNPPGTRQWIRRIMALPLVPSARVAATFVAIQHNAPNLQGTQEMHQYVSDTYVGANAVFDVSTWNVFNTSDRTTNICEGFHSALNKAMGKSHPSIYKLIDFWKTQDDCNERIIAQLNLGAPAHQRKKKYVRVDEAISRLVHGTFMHAAIPNVQQILQYLDAASYQLWDNK